MARSEFTVPGPADLDPDLRVQIDTAFDDSGTTVTDVLIGGRVADGSQGFLLRGVGTFLGPDGVTTVYLKSLDYRGRIVGFPVQVTGASGGSGTSVVITDPNDVRVGVAGKTYLYDLTSPGASAFFIADAVLTNGSPTLTSVTGGFLASVQVGQTLDDDPGNAGGSGVIPPGTTVAAVVDDNTLTMSANATGDASPDAGVYVGYGPVLLAPATAGDVVTAAVVATAHILIYTNPAGGNVAGNLTLTISGEVVGLYGIDGTNVSATTTNLT